MATRPNQPIQRFRALCLAGVVSLAALLPNADVQAAERVDAPAATSPQSAAFAKAAPESVEDLLAIEEQVQRIIGKITAATVGVRIGPAQGSGVIVSRSGYVLTAAHVSGSPGRSVTLILPSGRRVAGTTLGLNSDVDAGLIKIDEPGDWPYVEMGDLKNVKAGDWCIATGHPGGYREDRPPVVRLGRIVVVRSSVVQSDCTLVGGDSGGPLFDLEGRVVGINSRIGRPTSWNFHVPVSYYTRDWNRLANSEVLGGSRSGGPMIGVAGEDHERGTRITRIVSGYPAEKAGLKVGDVILRIDGNAVEGFDGLVELIDQRKPGEKVAVDFLRDGDVRRVTLTLAERP